MGTPISVFYDFLHFWDLEHPQPDHRAVVDFVFNLPLYSNRGSGHATDAVFL